MQQRIRTVIVGAGQAGLSTSRLLCDADHEHVVLERSDVLVPSWRGRWDSFSLVTPNWHLQLPGDDYDTENPEGFLARDEIVDHLEQYAAAFDPPVRLGVHVAGVDATDNGGFVVETDKGRIAADNVVVATGTFQAPRIPSFSEHLSPRIHQLHTSDYRNPAQLPDGGVLVVGSGQSGCQIAQPERVEPRRVGYLAETIRQIRSSTMTAIPSRPEGSRRSRGCTSWGCTSCIRAAPGCSSGWAETLPT